MNEAVVAMNVTLKCWIFKDSQVQLWSGEERPHHIKFDDKEATKKIVKKIEFEFSRRKTKTYFLMRETVSI